MKGDPETDIQNLAVPATISFPQGLAAIALILLMSRAESLFD
jgi:hypothetical protein